MSQLEHGAAFTVTGTLTQLTCWRQEGGAVMTPRPSSAHKRDRGMGVIGDKVTTKLDFQYFRLSL